MKLVKTLCLAIALGGAGSLQAQTCSGGSYGGMDATGNQCNAPRDVGGAISKSAISVSSPPPRRKSASPAGSRPPPDCAGRAPSLSNAKPAARTRE